VTSSGTSRVLQNFPPQELSQYTYLFVDFLLDESHLQQNRPLSILGSQYVPIRAEEHVIEEVSPPYTFL
jgi:hypothetical protein